MNTASKTAAIALLLAAMTGCTPKAKTPPQAQAPTITTGQGTLYPPPLTQPDTKPATPPPTPPPVTTAEAPPQPAPKPTPPKRTTHKKKPATPPADSAPAATPAQTPGQTPPQTPAQTAETKPPDQATTTQQASTGEPAAVSPIGTLSSGSESTGAQTRAQTVDLIHSTETSLNSIKRPLSTTEQETATKIRDFLEKARQALGVQDLDGAHTLANKAKVLLDELTKQ
jgi:hypothetical protein